MKTFRQFVIEVKKKTSQLELPDAFYPFLTLSSFSFYNNDNHNQLKTAESMGFELDRGTDTNDKHEVERQLSTWHEESSESYFWKLSKDIGIHDENRTKEWINAMYSVLYQSGAMKTWGELHPHESIGKIPVELYDYFHGTSEEKDKAKDTIKKWIRPWPDVDSFMQACKHGMHGL